MRAAEEHEPLTSDLEETQCYMHLSPAVKEEVIRLLERRRNASGFGYILETGIGGEAKPL